MYLLFLDKLCPGFSSVIQESYPGPVGCAVVKASQFSLMPAGWQNVD